MVSAAADLTTATDAQPFLPDGEELWELMPGQLDGRGPRRDNHQKLYLLVSALRRRHIATGETEWGTTRERLSRAIGCSDRALDRALDQLQAMGVVEHRRAGPGSRNHLRLRLLPRSSRSTAIAQRCDERRGLERRSLRRSERVRVRLAPWRLPRHGPALFFGSSKASTSLREGAPRPRRCLRWSAVPD